MQKSRFYSRLILSSGLRACVKTGMKIIFLKDISFENSTVIAPKNENL